MKIGIITVRDPDYHPNRRLIEAATGRGHRLMLVHPYQVWPVLCAEGLRLMGQPELQKLDVVLPRQGATVGDSCLPLIRHFQLKGIPVVNNLDSVLVAKNQFRSLQALKAAEIPVPDTLFVNSEAGFEKAVDYLGGYPVVAKQVSGRQGQGIVLVETEKDTEQILKTHFDKRRGILLQRFISPAGRTDIRVFVLGGRIVGAMELKPKEGDFRANYHLSGKSWPKDLRPDLEALALRATSAIGLEIAGVDLIVDKKGHVCVIEVNYSPGFRGLEAATGLDVAGMIVGYVVETYGERAR